MITLLTHPSSACPEGSTCSSDKGYCDVPVLTFGYQGPTSLTVDVGFLGSQTTEKIKEEMAIKANELFTIYSSSEIPVSDSGARWPATVKT